MITKNNIIKAKNILTILENKGSRWYLVVKSGAIVHSCTTNATPIIGSSQSGPARVAI